MIEVIGTLEDGHTLTVGAAPAFTDALAVDFTDAGAIPVGVVAASVTLSGPEAYHRLAGSTDVLLVDLTGDIVRQELLGDPGLVGTSEVDVLLNDVYWGHAGLEQ